MDLLHLNVDGDIATITLNRDDARNAISNVMAAELLDCLRRAEDQGARVVILRANPGASVWCAGHDLQDLDPAALERENLSLEVCRKIQASPLPVIAVVDGQVFGGGMLLLLCCDMVIATESATVAFTANKLGIPLESHWYAYLISVAGLHMAKQLLLTAAPITADDALRCGLYNRLVAADRLEDTVAKIAAQMIACSAEGLAHSKRTLNAIAAQLALTAEEQEDIRERNAQLLESDDVRERIAALWNSIQR